MLKRVLFFISFIIIISLLLFMGYEDPNGIEVTFKNKVYNTSFYFVSAVILILIKAIYWFFSVFSFTKSLLKYVIGFFTGRSERRSKKALLDAFSYALAGKVKTAQKSLNVAEKYYKDHKYTSLLRLILDHKNGINIPSVKDLAVLEKQKDFNDLEAFANRLYEKEKDSEYYTNLTEKSEIYKEDRVILDEYISALVSKKDYDSAVKITKNSKELLGEEQNNYHAFIHTKKALALFKEKQYDKAISASNKALRYNEESKLAFLLSFNSYIRTEQDSKALRAVKSIFSKKPSVTASVMLLSLKKNTEKEGLSKSIASLSRSHKNYDAFIFLQAYNAASTGDINFLSTLIENEKSDHIWINAAKLVIITENDKPLNEQALELFYNSLTTYAKTEINEELKSYPSIFQKNLYKILEYADLKSEEEVKASIEMFKAIIKHIPIDNNTKIGIESGDIEQVKRLYSGKGIKDNE